MNLLKSKLSLAIAIGLLSGPALAAAVNCSVTPVNSIITQGQTLQLAAQCSGGALSKINWQMDGTSVTGDVNLAGHTDGGSVYYTTPVGLPSSGTSEFSFTVIGTPASANDTWGVSSIGKVVVQPTSAALALAYQVANPLTPINASCGTAAGSAVQNMPTGLSQCSSGSKAALAISGPQSFTWSCLSLTGGTEANCYALRGNTYTVTATPGAGGNISPSSQLVNSNTSTSFTVTANTGYNVSGVTGCSGSLSGSTYTTGAITGACSVSATFAAQASSYTVTPTAGTGGSISPANPQTVNASGTTSFTVAAASGYTVSGVTGCGGTLTNGTYTTGAITSACTVAATFAAQQQSGSTADPGTGTWIPPNTTGRVIASQSGSTSQYLTSYIPGCLNGENITSSSNSGCGGKSSYTDPVSGTSFAFGSGKTLGLRYTSKAGAGATVKYFTLASGDGGNVGQTLKVWLSDSPTATYETTAATCRTTSTQQPYIITGPGYCPIVANKQYYLFISTDAAGTNFRYLVNEGSADFY